MSAEENARLVREHLQNVSADAFAEDAELHDLSQPRPLRGRDAIRAFLDMYLGEAFPQGAYELRSLVADGRGAAAEWTFRGVNSGPLMGAPATGRAVEFRGVSVYEIEGGRISRLRIYYDTGTLAEQLGLTGERLPSSERERWGAWWRSRVGGGRAGVPARPPRLTLRRPGPASPRRASPR